MWISFRYGFSIFALYLDSLQIGDILPIKPAIEMTSHESSRIVRFEDSVIAGKLMAMGILPHAQVELVRRNALGRTFVFRINSRFKIALRRDEAITIIVETA